VFRFSNNDCRRRIFTAAALTAVFVCCLFLMVKFEPIMVSASDSIENDIWSHQTVKSLPTRQFKILHVMSYHSPWEWTDNQFNGFQSALTGLNIQYHVMQMDAKRKSDELWKMQISKEICDAINVSKPDLVFAGDDVAQQYVTKNYVNSPIPIVFCAVNESPEKYGFAGAKNVTGVLEKIHYTATIHLLKKLVPGVKKAAILCDTGAMWPPMIEEMKQQHQKEIEIVSFDIISTFDDFKQKVLAYQDSVDALGFLGVFEFVDENGKNVPMEDVLKWLQNNSRLPDFSFWEDRVLKGTLCSVTISAYEQGNQAGVYAREILVNGKSPSEIPMMHTEKGIPLINLAAAKRLNIKPEAELLLISKVIQDIAIK